MKIEEIEKEFPLYTEKDRAEVAALIKECGEDEDLYSIDAKDLKRYGELLGEARERVNLYWLLSLVELNGTWGWSDSMGVRDDWLIVEQVARTYELGRELKDREWSLKICDEGFAYRDLGLNVEPWDDGRVYYYRLRTKFRTYEWILVADKNGLEIGVEYNGELESSYIVERMDNPWTKEEALDWIEKYLK